MVAKIAVTEHTLPVKNSEISLRVVHCQLMVREIFLQGIVDGKLL